MNLLGKFASGGNYKTLGSVEIGIDYLEYSDAEGRGLSGSGLRLGNSVFLLDKRWYRLLLDRARYFKTVTVNPPKKPFIQAQIFEFSLR